MWWRKNLAGERAAARRHSGEGLRLQRGPSISEGTDYAPLVDPNLNPTPGNFDIWHMPPTISVPPGSRLAVGTTVSADYYTVIPIGGSQVMQVGVCLSEPDVQQWVEANIQAMTSVFPSGTGVFLGYDEMRQMNTCELCQSLNLTAGQLLAQNVGQTWTTIQGVAPGVQGYVWGDMFDPLQNATDAYETEDPVIGDIAGSWLGLQPGFIIMNWNLGNLSSSLSWFAGLPGGAPHAFHRSLPGTTTAVTAQRRRRPSSKAPRVSPGSSG